MWEILRESLSNVGIRNAPLGNYAVFGRWVVDSVVKISVFIANLHLLNRKNAR